MRGRMCSFPQPVHRNTQPTTRRTASGAAQAKSRDDAGPVVEDGDERVHGGFRNRNRAAQDISPKSARPQRLARPAGRGREITGPCRPWPCSPPGAGLGEALALAGILALAGVGRALAGALALAGVRAAALHTVGKGRGDAKVVAAKIEAAVAIIVRLFMMIPPGVRGWGSHQVIRGMARRYATSRYFAVDRQGSLPDR